MALPQVCNTSLTLSQTPCAPGALLYHLWAGDECRAPRLKVDSNLPWVPRETWELQDTCTKALAWDMGSLSCLSSCTWCPAQPLCKGFTVQIEGTAQFPAQVPLLEDSCIPALSPEEAGNTTKMRGGCGEFSLEPLAVFDLFASTHKIT